VAEEPLRQPGADGEIRDPGIALVRRSGRDKAHLDQPSNVRATFYWGHAPNSQTRGLEMKVAMDKLDLLVVIDPFPSATAAMAAMPKDPNAKYEPNPNREVYLLPAATQFESEGRLQGRRTRAIAPFAAAPPSTGRATAARPRRTPGRWHPRSRRGG